ncbi:MAG TPA: hypothetical protein EYP23_06010 [Thermoplasmata archaeon]|nr:hypothetical protein [Thermoplasmata archaeon]
MIDLFLIVLFSIAGLSIGCITGLIPGLHVNTISLLILSSIDTFVIILQPLGVQETFLVTLIGVFIAALALVHTFVNIIPATFLGAPDEDVALSILPAHKLLLRGKGYEAVTLSAFGSFGALVVSTALLVPFKFILSDPLNLYTILNENMFWILLAVVILMIATEKPKEKKTFYTTFKVFSAAATVIVLSGVFGLLIMDLPINSPLSLPSSILFPALAGLFGMSTQIHSLRYPAPIKAQTFTEPHFTEREKHSTIFSILLGTLAGAFVAIIPGITAATGTIMAMSARGETDERQTIVTLSAVNTANVFLVVAILFILEKARSGAAVALSNILLVEEWNETMPPLTLIHLLISLLVAGAFAYPLTCMLGKKLAKHINSVPYTQLIKATIVVLIVLTFLFTGLLGLFILMVATAIGLIPLTLGVRRNHCMGVLILPLMLHFL